MLPDYVPVRCLGAGTAGNSALDGAFMSDTHRSACVDHTGPASDSRNPDLFRHGAGLTGTGKTDAAGSSDRCRTGCQYAGTFPAV